VRRFVEGAGVKLQEWAETCPTWPTAPADLRTLLEALYPMATDKALVRVGPDRDGGYLVPDDLEGLAALYSPGVSLESGFEKACAARGLDVFLADGSVDGPALSDPRFHFRKAFLGPLPADGVMTLGDWLDATSPRSGADLLLQMDIEGDEYGVLLTTPDDVLQRFRIMVIEFHSLHLLFTRQFYLIAAPVFRRLLATHLCVHLHPNTHCGFVDRAGLRVPRMMEFTFLRRDRVERATYATRFPHPLDRRNTDRTDFELSACWYAREGLSSGPARSSADGGTAPR